jgi:hypothetical protein
MHNYNKNILWEDIMNLETSNAANFTGDHTRNC